MSYSALSLSSVNLFITFQVQLAGVLVHVRRTDTVSPPDDTVASALVSTRDNLLMHLADLVRRLE